MLGFCGKFPNYVSLNIPNQGRGDQMKVTDNTHEMSFFELTSQPAQLHIPIFQRPYVWGNSQFVRMTEEIESIVDGEDANRFLGAIIAVRRFANPAIPQPFEIVDGQQRLTSLYLFLVAATQVATEKGNVEYASALINANLVVPWWQNGINTKLIPSYGDRGQFVSVFQHALADQRLAHLANTVRLPEANPESKGHLNAQYHRIRKYLNKQCNEGGLDRLQQIIEAARTRLTFVFIMLKDPATATTVFEGLNDLGVPIQIGDLVRNEVFARVGDDATAATAIHKNKWVPFQQRLGSSFSDFFFPFCVIHASDVLRADMFKELRKLWDSGLGPSEIIGRLDSYVGPFLAASQAQDIFPYNKVIQEALKRLNELRRPAAVYPFIMRLLKEHEKGLVGADEVTGILSSLESFLVRRALCGLEPTGLLGLFRNLWNNMEGNITASKFGEVVLRRRTLEWPSNERLAEQIAVRPLYGSSVAKFALYEYERSFDADFPTGVSMWIEHVCPRTLSEAWQKVFTQADHKALVDTWGNLIPLSSDMNGQLGQNEYVEKRATYIANSAFKSARVLGERNSEWRADEIRSRNIEIANWAVKRWPRPS